VSHAAAEPASLRERKKLRLRRGLQQIALRLFADQGYEHTTVEQVVTEAASRPNEPSRSPAFIRSKN
jgi:AcrR family transcriptional regulator